MNLSEKKEMFAVLIAGTYFTSSMKEVIEDLEKSRTRYPTEILQDLYDGGYGLAANWLEDGIYAAYEGRFTDWLKSVNFDE